VAGLVQPVASTAGWLFVTQHRTDEMFRWGLLSGAVVVGAIAIGVRWGPVGVAQWYAVATVLLFPALVGYVTSRGPVRAGAFYRAMAFPALSISTAALLVWSYRQIVSTPSAIEGLGWSLLLTLIGSSAPLATLPKGRAVVTDTIRLIRLARRDETADALVSSDDNRRRDS
jgi:PST family polysaccharide transporter